jgi:hypothetical protein
VAGRSLGFAAGAAPLDSAGKTEQAGAPGDDVDADFRGLDVALERAVIVGRLQRVEAGQLSRTRLRRFGSAGGRRFFGMRMDLDKGAESR